MARVKWGGGVYKATIITMQHNLTQKIFTFICSLFAIWIGVTVCWQTLVPLLLKKPSVTFDAIYVLFIAALTCLAFAFCVYKVGRTAWRSQEIPRKPALAGTMAVVVGVVLSVLVGNNAIALPPQACAEYLQIAGEPTSQLTDKDCIVKQSMPLFVKDRNNCAVYFRQTAPNTYEQLEPVCARGFRPAPRP